jgi:hypothetical protein
VLVGVFHGIVPRNRSIDIESCEVAAVHGRWYRVRDSLGPVDVMDRIKGIRIGFRNNAT